MPQRPERCDRLPPAAKTVCGDPSETYQRYALGMARRERLPSSGLPEDSRRKREELLTALALRGVRGWPSRRTLTTTGVLPEGCRSCLAGRGSNLCLTTLCNRDCFFCFNPKPRQPGMSVHGRPASDAAEAAQILAGLDVASVGLSGGEPLLDPELAVGVAKELRRKAGGRMRLDLYTNGDFLTRPLLRRLREAGVDGLRINLAARGYDPAPVRLAIEEGMPAEVEIPTVPSHEARLRALMDDLEEIGAPHLILHELFVSGQNLDSLRRLGLAAKQEAPPEALAWSPVSGSEETVYRLMAHAMERKLRLSVYYCSCGTQEWIAQRALARDSKRRGAEPPQVP